MSSVLPEYGNGKLDARDAIMDTGEQDVAVDQPDEVFTAGNTRNVNLVG